MSIITNEDVQAARIINLATELRANLKEFFSHISPVTRPIPYENPVHFEVPNDKAELRKKVLQALPNFVPELREGSEYTEFVWYHEQLEKPTGTVNPFFRCYLLYRDNTLRLFHHISAAFHAATKDIPNSYIEQEDKQTFVVMDKITNTKLDIKIKVQRVES